MDNKNKDKDWMELVNGRQVQHFASAKNKASVYIDTGEVYDAATAATYALLYIGDEDLGVAQPRANAPIFFWVKKYIVDAKELTNIIRGYPLGFFEPPASFSKDSETENNEESEETTVVKTRLACWVLTTAPTRVKDANKAIVLAPIGSVVWMDISPGNVAVARSARPLDIDQKTMFPKGLVEIQVEPLDLIPISNGPDGGARSTWKMNVSGGWKQAKSDAITRRRGGFRMLNAAQVESLADRLIVPEIMTIDEARAWTLGSNASQVPDQQVHAPAGELPAGHGAPRLPATGSATPAN